MASFRCVGMLRGGPGSTSLCQRTEAILLTVVALVLFAGTADVFSRSVSSHRHVKPLQCECQIMATIVCNNLDAVPEFENDDVVYNAIHMSRQGIPHIARGRLLPATGEKDRLELQSNRSKYQRQCFLTCELGVGRSATRGLPDPGPTARAVGRNE